VIKVQRPFALIAAMQSLVSGRAFSDAWADPIYVGHCEADNDLVRQRGVGQADRHCVDVVKGPGVILVAKGQVDGASLVLPSMRAICAIVSPCGCYLLQRVVPQEIGALPQEVKSRHQREPPNTHLRQLVESLD
jgi:hypothetical protein